MSRKLIDFISALYFINFSPKEHNLLKARVWLKTRSFGVVYMSRQVMEILMAISRFYIQILPFRSRNAIFSLHDSYVNLMVVWNSLIRLCKKL